MLRHDKHTVLHIFLAIIAAVTAASFFAPYIFAELLSVLDPHAITSKGQARSSSARTDDNYWLIQKIGPGTFAIGEPLYYQYNYSYLLVGTRTALLFDSGSGVKNISLVVAKLTRLPVTVLPSHLHYDHLAGITAFRSIAMIDLPQTRANVSRGWFVPGRYDYLGMVDSLPTPRFHVTRWIKPKQWVDLGERRVRLISTPGHTPTSVSIYDPSNDQLFAGDLVYPGPLYVQLPGASRSAYRATVSALVTSLPPRTKIWSAHCCRMGVQGEAPWLTMSDLVDLRHTLDLIAQGKASSRGFYPRIFPVNDQMRLFTGFPWTNR